MVLHSRALAVERIVGGSLKALLANAGGPASGASLAESRGCAERGALGGAEAEHDVSLV